jgi:hypothetical protein
MKRCNWITCEHPGVKICGACASVAYCSDTCQKLDWKKGGHKAICSFKKSVNTTCNPTYGDLFSHIKSLRINIARSGTDLSLDNPCLTLLEDYKSRGDREFTDHGESTLCNTICEEYINSIDYLFEMEKAPESTITEYLQRFEAALMDAEVALARFGRQKRHNKLFKIIEVEVCYKRSKFTLVCQSCAN